MPKTKFHLGIVVQTSLESGGAHSYERSFVQLVSEIALEQNFDLTVFAPNDSWRESFGQEIRIARYKLSPARMALEHLRSTWLGYSLLRLTGFRQSNLERLVVKNSISLVIFSSPNHLAPGFNQIPYISTAWDFGHRDRPAAYEVSMNGLWHWREELYRTTLPKSMHLICDSVATANRARDLYSIDAERITPIGLLPRVGSTNSSTKFDLPHLIYPAMFWPHKNHRVLLEAMASNPNVSKDFYLVFTGAGAGESGIKEMARELGVAERVKFLGLVSREELEALILGSSGLLMPSLIGPSNLPPLEASLLGIPVAISDSHNMEDLLPGAFIVNGSSPADWKNAMESLLGGKIKICSISDLSPKIKIEMIISSAKSEIEPWVS